MKCVCGAFRDRQLTQSALADVSPRGSAHDELRIRDKLLLAGDGDGLLLSRFTARTDCAHTDHPAYLQVFEVSCFAVRACEHHILTSEAGISPYPGFNKPGVNST